MNLKDTYNKIANDWYRDHKDDTWWMAGADVFCSFLPKGSTVLDVGCGAGKGCKFIGEKGLKVVGVDFSEKMVEIAQGLAPEADVSVLDIYDLDTLAQTFDGVFAKAILLHVPKKDIPLVFEKLVRKVKVGGYLYVAVKEQKSGELAEEIKREEDYGYPYERFFSYFTLSEVEELFKQAGLEIVYKNRNKFGRIWIEVIGRR